MTGDRSSEFVRERVAALGLEPHPEGGFYREIYRSAATLPLPRGTRNLMTVIHFVLPPGAVSAWHLVRADEAWCHLAGDPLELHRVNDAGSHDVVHLGAGPGGASAAAVVPAGVWQAAKCAGAVGSHVVCTVAPGFDFRDFAMADADALSARFPALAGVLRQFASRPATS